VIFIEAEFHTVRGYQMLNSENKLLTPSMEDYLEMLKRISNETDYIRVNQLATRLNVNPSSASKVIQKIKKLGLVDYEKYGIITLTDDGNYLGDFLLRRHNIIDDFLKNIGIEEKRLKETEMLEHDISVKTLENIYLLNKFLEHNPQIKKEYELFKFENSKKIDFSCHMDNK
jgi:Mn-dependent DtxR family transcriptional regulator